MAETLQRTILKAPGLTISFDCVEAEDVTHDATMTRYPVEAGAKLTDHVIIEPDVVRLTVHITNAPLLANKDVSHMDGVTPLISMNLHDDYYRAPPAVPFQPAVVGPRMSAMVQAQVRAWGAQGAMAKRIQNVYSAMLKAQSEVTLFTVVTEHRPYDNMAIKSVRMNRTSKTVRAPKFELELHQLNTANLSTRDVSSRLPQTERSKPAKDAGKKQPVEADAKTEKKSRESALHYVGGKVF